MVLCLKLFYFNSIMAVLPLHQVTATQLDLLLLLVNMLLLKAHLLALTVTPNALCRHRAQVHLTAS